MLKACLKAILLIISMIGALGVVHAAESVVADLQRRLTTSDVSTVNAYLSANWETKMKPLGNLVQHCDLRALKLGASLLQTTNLEALQGHVYFLELAMGKCPEKLLPLVPLVHIKSLCAVDAYADSHPASKLVDELDRRIQHIRTKSSLATSTAGKTCLDAYEAARQDLR